MKEWTSEELSSTRDKLEAWSLSNKQTGWGPRLWILTAILGAFAVSTGTVFIVLDGITAISIFLIIIGMITCYSWYKSERQKKSNIAFLSEVNKELTYRKRQASKSKTEDVAAKNSSNTKSTNKKQAKKTVKIDKDK